MRASVRASTSWAARAAISNRPSGGTSPPVNPLFRVPRDLRFSGNVIPSFITPDGPIREVRFQFKSDGTRDGGVHALFVITGHPDAPPAATSGRRTSSRRSGRQRHLPDSRRRCSAPG